MSGSTRTRAPEPGSPAPKAPRRASAAAPRRRDGRGGRGAERARRGVALPAALRAITPTGRAVALSGLVAALLAAVLGWVEAYAVTVCCAVLLLVALALVLWPSPHAVEVRLPQDRVVAGQTAVGDLTVRNVRSRPAGPGVIELPIGAGAGEFLVPPLAPGGEWNEIFSVVTRRRGIIAVGPARSVRSDGLGLVRRIRSWDRPEILRVYPRTVRAPFDATGFLMDVEGAVTAKLSSSDIAFHALRDYEPGDDRRNVHWASTARLGRLIVRQFEETRRSHHMIVLDTAEDAWDDADAFETGVSVAASLALVGLEASRRVSVATGSAWLATSSATRLLDEFAEIDRDARTSIAERVRHCLDERPDASALSVVVPAGTSDEDAARLLAPAGPDVLAGVVRIRPGAARRRRRLGRGVLVDCPSLDDLPRLVFGGLA